MSVQSGNPATPGVCLYCMCGGTLTFDQSVFTHMQGMGTAIEVPTPIFLIEHPEGKVVFETGLHPAVATNRGALGATSPRLEAPDATKSGIRQAVGVTRYPPRRDPLRGFILPLT